MGVNGPPAAAAVFKAILLVSSTLECFPAPKFIAITGWAAWEIPLKMEDAIRALLDTIPYTTTPKSPT